MRSLVRIAMVIAPMVTTMPVFAAGAGNVVGLNAEFGANGNYGLVGLEGTYFPSQNFDLHAGAGLSAASALGGGGFRIYTSPSECFWFKHCKDRYFIGVNFATTLSSSVKETSDGVEREYRIPKTQFANVSVGDSTVFFDRLNFMLHLGYKFALQKHVPEQVSGPEDQKANTEVELALKSGPQVSVGAGLVF